MQLRFGSVHVHAVMGNIQDQAAGGMAAMAAMAAMAVAGVPAGGTVYRRTRCQVTETWWSRLAPLRSKDTLFELDELDELGQLRQLRTATATSISTIE